ncbi:hypothetical protein GCM10020219_076370 [Nonomuraea dietziae]
MWLERMRRSPRHACRCAGLLTNTRVGPARGPGVGSARANIRQRSWIAAAAARTASRCAIQRRTRDQFTHERGHGTAGKSPGGRVWCCVPLGETARRLHGTIEYADGAGITGDAGAATRCAASRPPLVTTECLNEPVLPCVATEAQREQCDWG